MPLYIPISRTSAAALTRIMDNVNKGYTRYVSGTIAADKICALTQKFRDRHLVHFSPAQRHTRKKNGLANALLTVYLPSSKTDAIADTAQWILLFTQGELHTPEMLRDVTKKPRLEWLGYELFRHTFRGRTSWTWRRTKEEMQYLLDLLTTQCRSQQWSAVALTLKRVASQPGFHGVREQSYRLCQEAQRRGYDGSTPHLYFMRKIKHGEPIVV